jgi:hypothetical protein
MPKNKSLLSLFRISNIYILATAGLVWLKLSGNISWDWFWIFSPIWLSLLLDTVMYLIMGLFVTLLGVVLKDGDKKITRKGLFDHLIKEQNK